MHWSVPGAFLNRGPSDSRFVVASKGKQRFQGFCLYFLHVKSHHAHTQNIRTKSAVRGLQTIVCVWLFTGCLLMLVENVNSFLRLSVHFNGQLFDILHTSCYEQTSRVVESSTTCPKKKIAAKKCCQDIFIDVT